MCNKFYLTGASFFKPSMPSVKIVQAIKLITIPIYNNKPIITKKTTFTITSPMLLSGKNLYKTKPLLRELIVLKPLLQS